MRYRTLQRCNGQKVSETVLGCENEEGRRSVRILR